MESLPSIVNNPWWVVKCIINSAGWRSSLVPRSLVRRPESQHLNPLRDSSQASGIIIVVGHLSIEDHTSDQLERIWCAWRQAFYIEIQRGFLMLCGDIL